MDPTAPPRDPLVLDRILFGTDFGPTSAEAERYVQVLAAGLGAEVVAFHAIEPIAALDDDEADNEFYRSLERNAASALARISARLSDERIPVITEVVIGARWQSVIEAAVRHGASFVVIGARPLENAMRGPLGTTSHNVFLASPVPVLTVRGQTAATDSTGRRA